MTWAMGLVGEVGGVEKPSSDAVVVAAVAGGMHSEDLVLRIAVYVLLHLRWGLRVHTRMLFMTLRRSYRCWRIGLWGMIYILLIWADSRHNFVSL